MGDTAQPRRVGARLSHKKSRTGCQRCKARRVKCDEARPACGSCSRHEVPCVYPPPPSSQSRPTQNPLASRKDSKDTRDNDNITLPPITSFQQPDATINDPLHIPESNQRRMLELRLWHTYLNVLARVFEPINGKHMLDIWQEHIPNLALQHENLQHSIYACSSTFLLRTEPQSQELTTAHQLYLSLALREQREAVSEIETMEVAVTDSVCFTSLFICMDAFATLQDRNREPYLPPVDLFRLGMGAFAVFYTALLKAQGQEGSLVIKFLEGPPKFNGNYQEIFSEANRKPFIHLLGARTPDGRYEEEELWDAEVSTAYERTLSYIGTLLTYVENQTPLFILVHKILTFSFLVPKKFVDMLEELRPRALVILAHFFALASKAASHWWVGQAPFREIQGLLQIVPSEWQHQMQWPLVMSGMKSE